MNTWFERNHEDTGPDMNNLLLPDEATTPSDHQAISLSTDQISWRINPEQLQSQPQEISPVHFAPGTEPDLYNVVTNRRIAHEPEASLIPRSSKTMQHADTNLVPPRIRLAPRQDLRQTSPLMRNVMHPRRNEAILNLVAPPEFNGTAIHDLPTQIMVAVGIPVLKGEAKKSKKKSVLSIVIRAVITVLLFAFLLKSMNWATLVPTLLHVSHTYLLIGLSAGMLCVLFSSYGWRSIVLAENIQIDLARLINLYLVGISFSHFLPTSMGGDALKVYYVGRDSGNMAGAASAVLMSRITSFVGMLLIALPALAILHKHFSQQVIVWFVLLSLLLIAAIVGSVIAAFFLPSLSGRFLKGKWAKNAVVVKFLEVGEALSAAIKRPRSMFSATLFGMLFWGASFLNYYGYAVALGLYVPLTFYIIAIPFVSIIAALPISINGFGVREGAFVYLFTTIHVLPTTSLSLALLMDAQVLLFGLIGGCIYLTMNDRKR